MQVGTVVGTVVSTQKHAKLHGAKLLLVQPELPDGTARGTPVLAVGNKRDVATQAQLTAFRSRPATVLLAARRRDGLDELREQLLTTVRGEGLDRTGSSTWCSERDEEPSTQRRQRSRP